MTVFGTGMGLGRNDPDEGKLGLPVVAMVPSERKTKDQREQFECRRNELQSICRRLTACRSSFEAKNKLKSFEKLRCAGPSE